MWWLLIVVVFLILIGLLHLVIPKKYHWPSTLRRINKIPGPSSVPYFNNALIFIIENDEFIPTLIKLMDQYKPLWKLSILGFHIVFLSELDDIEVILSSRTHITKGDDYTYLIPWLGTGLLISNGKKWFDHRKWLTPAFHFSILEQYIDIMNKNAKILCDILQNCNKCVEINPLISNCALDIICETAMGTQVNAQFNGEQEYVKAILRMSQIFTQRTLAPWLHRNIIFNRLSIGKEHNRLLKIVHGFTEKVIKERKKAFREAQVSKENASSKDHDFEVKKKMSFLDLLIEIFEKQNSLTEEEIREEVDTFMFEGHDTTATALIWALFELGLNPDIQEKVYEEQQEIFGGSDKSPTFSDLQEMKYLERVIKETLRLYPSVPLISRKLNEDVEIKNYIIPAGTEVPIFIYYLHRDPQIYPEPEKFDPNRFTPELMRDRHPYSYIPFSAGPRNCIGQRFAMMEEKIVLSHIIRRYKIVTIDKREDVKVMGEVVLRPKNNIRVSFTSR